MDTFYTYVMLWRITTILPIIHAITCQAYHDVCRKKTIVTFNTGLVPTIPLYESRKFQLAHALRKANADVVCLQEVQYEDDISRVLDELQWEYPFSLHLGTLSSTETFRSKYFGDLYQNLGEKPFPCSDPAFPTFQQCTDVNCASVEGNLPRLFCVFQNCISEGFALSDDCLSCLVISASSPQTELTKCVTATQTSMRNRFQAEGLLILSKKRIKSAKKMRYFPNIQQIYPRGLLEVDIEEIGKVVCTHLVSDGSVQGFPYTEVKLSETLGITSFAEQQFREIAQIKELYGDKRVIVAGDFNTGPAVPSQNVKGELPQNYASLIAGFDNPYVDQVGECTYCSDNPIAVNVTTIIDHVLLNGVQTDGVTRIFDNTPTPLSDHYGVSVSFCGDDDQRARHRGR